MCQELGSLKNKKTFVEDDTYMWFASVVVDN